jgi:hypothetical protein
LVLHAARTAYGAVCQYLRSVSAAFPLPFARAAPRRSRAGRSGLGEQDHQAEEEDGHRCRRRPIQPHSARRGPRRAGAPASPCSM